MDTQELDRRIDSFLTKKQEKYPELNLRSSSPQQKSAMSIYETLLHIATGFKLNLSR